MKNWLQRIAAPLLSLLILTSIQGCKKSSGGGGDTNTTGYYFTATVNGKAFAANVSNNTLHSPSTGILVNSGGISLAAVIGIQAQGKDSTALVLIFPSNITLNQQAAFDDSKYSEGAYATMTAGYNSLPANKGSGTLTVTSFDQTAKTIEGTFSGTFGIVNGGATNVKITDGKFRAIYTTDTSPGANPFPPNVKF